MNKIYKILGKRGRITIPFSLRQKIGFKYNDVISFSDAEDGSIIVKKEKLCNCEKASKSEDISITLLDFLDTLTEAEKRAALIHLSVNWANKGKEKTFNG